MRRILSVLLGCCLLAACAPELIPVPLTQAPTLPPATPTSVVLDGTVVPNPGLVAIRMQDPQNGWGINDDQVLRTADGGATWHNVSPANSGPLGYSADFEFLDLQHGWILVPDPNNMLAGTLYRTEDGGATWSNIPVPFGGGEMHFLDPKQGWMMASLGAGAGSMGVAIYQTSDGGSTWIETYTNDPTQTGAGDSLPLGGLKDGLTVLDMQTGWIGGVVYTPGTIYLYETQDAGHTWKLSPVPVPAGYEQSQPETRGPAFVSPASTYLAVQLSSQNGVMAAIYRSRDEGTSWLLTPTLIPQGGAVDFVSGQDGFVWNGSSFYVTHDGAQTWKSVSPDVTFGDSFARMDFVNATTGFVLTSDASNQRTLYKTIDGGATWNVLGH